VDLLNNGKSKQSTARVAISLEALLDCRLSSATHRYEMLVKWYGHDDVESSWEPAENIKQDVP
jgi:hypothetical protein